MTGTPANGDDDPTGRRRRVGLTLARVLYLSVVAAALVALGWSQRADVAGLIDGARLELLAAALAVAFVQLALMAGFWAMGLRALAEPLPFATVLDATARSLLARYIPGSLWYALGRSALLRRQRVSGRALGVVAVLETGLSVVVGFVVGAGLLLATRQVAPAVGVLALVGMVAVAAVCSPPSVNVLLAWIARRRGGTPVRLGWSPFLVLVAWLVLFWATSAVSFAVYLAAFPGAFPPPDGLPPLLEVAGAFMVARTLGMLAVFAPQGLGVFEVAVAALLAVGTAGADDSGHLASLVLVVAGYRALVLVRDAVAVALAEARHSTRPAPAG